MKKYTKIIKMMISLGILAYLFRLVDFDILWEQFSELNQFIFLIVFGILFIQCVLSSLKWKIILTAEGKTLPFLFLLKSYLIGILSACFYLQVSAVIFTGYML